MSSAKRAESGGAKSVKVLETEALLDGVVILVWSSKRRSDVINALAKRL